jgi:hypothetical protein
LNKNSTRFLPLNDFPSLGRRIRKNPQGVFTSQTKLQKEKPLYIEKLYKGYGKSLEK